jgi:hypothetical protein
VDADEGGGDLLGRLLLEQALGEGAILLLDLDRLEQAASSRSWSFLRMSSGVGGLIHSASILAPRSTISTRLRLG